MTIDNRLPPVQFVRIEGAEARMRKGGPGGNDWRCGSSEWCEVKVVNV